MRGILMPLVLLLSSAPISAHTSEPNPMHGRHRPRSQPGWHRAPARGRPAPRGSYRGVSLVDRIPGALAFIKRYGAFVTADLNTFATIARQWGRPAVVEEFLRMPEIRYLAPDDTRGRVD